MPIDIKKTQDYYRQLSDDELCTCAYCKNYVRRIKSEYPEVAEYLQELGVDIEKPLETMPLDPDGDEYINYIAAQYVVLGEQTGFESKKIGSVDVVIASSNPSTGVEEPHFVIEIFSIRLKWDEQQCND